MRRPVALLAAGTSRTISVKILIGEVFVAVRMANYPPTHCSQCGAELDDVEPPTIFHCQECDAYRFHNPYPAARVLVLDGEQFLFVKQGRGRWESG